MKKGLPLIYLGIFWFQFNHVQGQITSFPYFEDFESGDGGYTTGGIDPSWELGSPSKNSINAAFSGDNAWVTSLESYANCPEESYLETPLLDFSEFANDPVLNFQAFLSFGTFSIEVSTDGGDNYSLLGAPTDPNWYDFTQGFNRKVDDYQQFSHPIDGTAGSSTVKIRFSLLVFAGTSATEGVALDDIEIKGVNDFTDLALTAINLPEFSPLLGASEEIGITVENFGASAFELAGVDISIDGPNGNISYFEELEESIDPLSTENITLPTMADLSTNGSYQVEVALVSGEDEIDANNSLCEIIGKVTAFSDPLPYEEDYAAEFLFEEQSLADIPGLLNHSFSTDEGLVVTAAFDERFDEFNGESFLFGSNVTGKASDVIVTLDLSDYDATVDLLRLSVRMLVLTFGDSPDNQIFIRGSANDPWLSIYDWQNEIGGKSTVSDVTLIGLSQVLEDGGQDYSSSFQVRFGAVADENSNTLLLLDDLIIEETPDIDIAVIGGTAPEISPLLSNSESLTIEIANYGKNTVSDIPLRALPIISTATPINETANITLMPGETTTYEFISGGDFDDIGNYTVYFSSEVVGDETTANDEIEIKTGKTDVYDSGLPFLEDFENGTNSINEITAVVTGLQAASFTTNAGGRLFFRSPEVFSSRYVIISGNNNNIDAELWFTLDLSEYDANTDLIRLGADLFNRFPRTLDNNKIFLRGAADENWIEILDWGTELQSSDLPLNFNFSEVSQALLDAGQNYGSTFQVRFATDDGSRLEVDNVFVEEIPNLDAAVIGGIVPEINPFLGSSESLSIEISNVGLLELNSIDVGYSVTNPDGSEVEFTETANITLAPGDSDLYEFSQTADLSLAGNYEFNFFIQSSSDGSDLNNELLPISAGKMDVYEEGLPFIENFNNVDFFNVRGKNVPVIDGLEAASFLTGNLNGLFSLSGSFVDEDFEAFMGLTNESTSDLVFTLDLSELDVTQDHLELKASLASSSNQNKPNNRIFIRGDASSEWIELFDWINELNNDGIYEDIRVQNVSEILALSGQLYGETFQIRFGQEESGTLRIDDIELDFVNNPPTVQNPIPDQALLAGFQSLDIDLVSVFNDPDSDPLVYTASLSQEGVVSTSLNNQQLTISEIAAGAVDITIIATDTDDEQASDVFNVTVTAQTVEPVDQPEEEDNDSVTGISGDELPVSFQLFPNPTITSVILSLDNFNEELPSIELISLSGRRLPINLVKLSEVSYELDLSGTNSGVYFISVRSKNQKLVKRIIKN